MKTLQELEKQLADIQKEVEALKQGKQEFKKGDWYYFSDGVNHWIAKFDYMKDGYFWHTQSYAINFPSENRSPDWCIVTETVRPATPTEIKEALEKEAVKRGIVEGVTIVRDSSLKNGHGFPVGSESKKILNYGTSYDKNEDRLFMDGYTIYEKGIWATVQKEQPLMIGGYEVKYDKQRCFEFEINGQSYNRIEIETLKTIMERGQVRSLNVGCHAQHTVDIGFINKMLALK